jgi:hypothetical protein
MSIVGSCIVLVWAICRLVRLANSLSKKMVNKVMVIMHIVAYMAIIISNCLGYLTFLDGGLKSYKIIAICGLTVYCVCSVIFGLIVN